MTDELAVTQPASDAAPVENVQAPAAPSPAPEKVDNVQKRIDKLTWKNHELQRQIDALQARPESKAPASETLKPPTRAEYDHDEDKFQDALLKYTDARAELIAEKKAQELLDKKERERESNARKQSFEQRQAEFIKSKPDYAEKVIEGARLEQWACTAEMAQVIQESEIGPEIAYYLAENEEKAAAIAQLSPFLQARELGRIEAQLEAQKTAKTVPAPAEKPKTTAAPPPVPKIEASESVVDKDPANMTDAEFAKWRRRQIAQRR